jgi:hypothetical protein
VIQPVGESIMSESQLYGSKTMSYQKLMDTRLIIKHSQTLADDMQPGARSRNISALFVENQDGERFKYPFIHLSGARAMQRHVANGGVPYDDLGKSIINMSEQIAQLKSFNNYVVRNDLMNFETNDVVERSQQQLNMMREQLSRLAKQSHYDVYKETFQPQEALEVPQEVVEDYTEKFTVKNFKEDIKSVFPVLYRLMKESELGYDDIVAMTKTEQPTTEDFDLEENDNEFDRFESWVMGLGEDSPIQSQEPEEQATAIQALQELVAQAFPIGVDGSNAVESLKGIIEDPQLEKQIQTQAAQDPEMDARGLVQQWLSLYAPEVLEQLDFGDFDPNATAEPEGEAPATDQGGEETAPEAPAAEVPAEEPVPQESQGDEEQQPQQMNVQEVAEFIHSFYDRDSGTFPKGPEGVCTMVGKKFGEQAEHVARKMVERMAPQQQDPQIAELARIRELAGY